ncbi:MAG: UPF0175 family protein [Acidobacteriota bacterium]
MNALDLDDLHQHREDLTGSADRLTLVTDAGRPVFVGVPLSGRLSAEGVGTDSALRLYDDGVLTLGKAAHLAELSTGASVALLQDAGIDAVRHDPDELEDDLEPLRGR